MIKLFSFLGFCGLGAATMISGAATDTQMEMNASAMDMVPPSNAAWLREGNWAWMGNSESGTQWFIDFDHSALTANPIRIRTRTDETGNPGSGQASTERTIEIDCQNRQARIVSSRAYDANGVVRPTSERGDGGIYQPVMGTMFSSVADGACHYAGYDVGIEDIAANNAL